MTTAILGAGPRKMALTVDAEGNREYDVIWLVESDDKYDGPFTVLLTPGLPVVGSFWAFGNDADLWAWCRPDAQVAPHQEKEGDSPRVWAVRQKFSTKSPSVPRCNEQRIEDPLLEPPKISGGFKGYSREATHDRFGNALQTSSHEQIRGAQVEFEEAYSTVRIEINVPILNLGLLASLINGVNDRPMWGMPRRTIKLTSGTTWEEKFYGLCYRYYTLKLEFDVNGEGFDRVILDEGTKVLNGHWRGIETPGTSDDTGDWVLDSIGDTPPDPDNPAHFIRAKDRNGENIKVVLDGEGQPAALTLAITACTECPDGAPTDWYLFGLRDIYSPRLTLTHSAGCTWAGTSEIFGSISLNRNSGYWAIEVEGYRFSYWFPPANTDWNCAGPNLLVKANPEMEGPPYLLLTRKGGPGRINVEKYNEVNLLQLGIPLTL